MAGHAPYFMPDGSTLAQALNQQEQHEPSRKGRKQKTAKADRWEQSFRLIRQHPATQTEQTELDYLYRVGRERRRRFLNDKLLRDMAGPLTAREMEGLFKPAPFGETNHTTPLQEVLQPDNATIWDLFRDIDFDKQNRLLQKWEDKLKQQGRRQTSSTSEAQRDNLSAAAPADISQEEAAFAALRKWAGTGKKCRQALRRAVPAAVEELELHYLQLMSKGDPDDRLVLELDDSFHRLQAHGLAEFHGLSSHSEPSSNDAEKRITVIQHSSAVSAQQNKERQEALQPGSCEITCADILMALEDRPIGGMNPAVLRRYMTGHTTESDAASEDLTLV